MAWTFDLAACALGSAVLLGAGPARAQSLVRLTDPDGRQQDVTRTSVQAIAPDGKLLVFASDGLVPADSDGLTDPAWFDPSTGSYAFVSTGLGGAPSDGYPVYADVSSSGLFVVLASTATNLVAGDTNAWSDVFVVERATGATVRASVGNGGFETNGQSQFADVSADGRFVAFSSSAVNLGPLGGPAPQSDNVYLRDLVAGTTVLVSTTYNGGTAGGECTRPQVSDDGRFVAYLSLAWNLVPGDTNDAHDVFLWDGLSGTTTRVNVGPGGIEDNFGALALHKLDMTPDGRWITFGSSATTLHPAATTAVSQVYVADRNGPALSLASLGPGGQIGTGPSYEARISSDGRWVAFVGGADNLDPLDGGGPDVFLHDRWSGTTRLMSVSSTGTQGAPPIPGLALPYVDRPVLSASGRFVAFESNMRGLVAGDTNWFDAFVRDTQSPCPAVESYCTPKVNSQGCTPRISSGGEPYASGPSDSFFVSAHGVLPARPGTLIWSFAQAATPFAGGTLCVAAPIRRTPIQIQATSPGAGNPAGARTRST